MWRQDLALETKSQHEQRAAWQQKQRDALSARRARRERQYATRRLRAAERVRHATQRQSRERKRQLRRVRTEFYRNYQLRLYLHKLLASLVPLQLHNWVAAGPTLVDLGVAQGLLPAQR